MDRPHMALAPGGGYLVDLAPDERWWVQPDVEPFRTISHTLARLSGETPVPMHLEAQEVRADLVELENLFMARRMP